MDTFNLELVGHYQMLTAFARRLTKGVVDVDDLVQDTVARALHSRSTYTHDTNMRGWLCTILRNRFISVVVRQSRFGPAYLEDEAVPEESLRVECAQDHAIELKETAAAIQRLPPKHQTALLLAAEGYSYQEAATQMDISPSAFKARLFRARTALVAALAY